MTLDRALDILAGLVLEDGRRWGEAAYPWQWEDARAILDPDGPTPYHYLTRPRGASKTGDLAGVCIAALLEQLDASDRAFAVAADRDQGRLIVDAMAGYVSRTPEIAAALRVDVWRVTANRTGAMLDVLAADGPSAWGLKPALVVVDELSQWSATPGPRQVWEAVHSAMPKVPGSRLVVLTSAGDPVHWSHRVLEHARSQDRWRVHEVPGPCPWIPEEALAEQRALLPESSYRRLHLNQWTAAEDRLVSVDDLRACVTLEGPLGPRPGLVYVIGCDLGLKVDRTAAAVVHAEPMYGDGATGVRIVLDRMQVWAGTRTRPVILADVEEWLGQAAHSFGAQVVFDPWQAAGMAERLRGRGIVVTEYLFSQSSVGRLAATLHLLLRDGALALPADEELLDELANVRLRETTPGVFRMDHDRDRHDDRAVALALAAHQLLNGVRWTRVPSVEELQAEEAEWLEENQISPY
jgi:phage terminase large subunit-like protein